MGVLTSWRKCTFFCFQYRTARQTLCRLTYLRPYGRIGILVTSRTAEVARLIVLSTWCRGGRSPVTGISDFRRTWTNLAWPWNFEGWSTCRRLLHWRCIYKQTQQFSLGTMTHARPSSQSALLIAEMMYLEPNELICMIRSLTCIYWKNAKLISLPDVKF